MQSSKRRKTANGWCGDELPASARWTFDDYTRRKADLEAMVRRFQWYLIGNNKQQVQVPSAIILTIAMSVFSTGDIEQYFTLGLTGETSGPLFELLTGMGKVEKSDGSMLPFYHAYAIQCGGTQTFALCKGDRQTELNLPTSKSFPLEMMEAKRLMDEGEEICNKIASKQPQNEAAEEKWDELIRYRDDALEELPKILDGALQYEDGFIFAQGQIRFCTDVYMGTLSLTRVALPETDTKRYAMDTSKLKAELAALLPLAKRLDEQQKTMDPLQAMQLAIRSAIKIIDNKPEMHETFLVDDLIQRLATNCPCESWWSPAEPWLDFGAKFVIVFVATCYSRLRYWARDHCDTPDALVWNRIESMERRLLLLKGYLLNPLSEPRPETKTEDLRQSKNHLISKHIKVLQELKQLKRLRDDRDPSTTALEESRRTRLSPQ